MKNALSLIVVSVLSVLLVSGCATTLDKRDRMNQSLFAYSKAVRWSRFEVVYAFHRAPEAEPREVPEDLENIRVTGYEVLSSAMDAEGREGIREVAIRYINQLTAREKTLEVEEHWVYNPELDRWYLDNPPPAFD